MGSCPELGAMMSSMPMSGAMGVGMALHGLLIAALIALAVAATVRLLRSRSASSVGPALAQLDLRYASGELDRDAYLERRADLGGDR